MRFLLSLVLSLSLCVLGGCAYQAQTPASPALNVYSSFDEKLPGRFVLVVDGSAAAARVNPSSFMCSAHSFPVDATVSFTESVRGTIANLVEEVETAASPPSREQLLATGRRGVIRVRAETFAARISFTPQFFTATANGSVDMSAGITVDGPEGRIFGTSAGAQRAAQGDAGGFCEGGSNVLAEATSGAIRDLMERIGERLSNSPRLRAAPSPVAPPPAMASPARPTAPAAQVPASDMDTIVQCNLGQGAVQLLSRGFCLNMGGRPIS